jgi:hypothetical protein
MTRLVTALALGAAALLAAPATAEPLKKVPAALNPAKAYILVEYKLQANPFGNWPGSRKTMPLQAGLTFARWDAAAGDIRGMGKAKPAPAGQQAAEGFRNKPLAKGEGTRLFLLEVEPDIWVIQAFGNTSFSLGSYTFELAPGTVTDLGVVTAEGDWAEDQEAPEGAEVLASMMAGPFGKKPDMAPIRLTFRPRGAGDLPVPAGIGAVRPVSFSEGAKFGNYSGGLVNRIDGVNARLKAQAAAKKAAAAPAGN